MLRRRSRNVNFGGKQKARTMRALSNTATASTPSRRLPVKLVRDPSVV